MAATAKRILCFGDSLTWGWMPVPEGVPSTRFPYEQRWTGVMATALGAGYEIIEEGLSARTTCIPDPIDPRLDGSAYLPAALASHLPLDLTILMLGTNDTKSYYRRTPHEIAMGMQKLVIQVLSSAGGVGTAYPAPKVLIVSPPPLTPIKNPWFASMFEGGHEKSAALAAQYRSLAEFMKVDFFHAGIVTKTGGVDGIHFTAENNAALGKALAGKVLEILG